MTKTKDEFMQLRMREAENMLDIRSVAPIKEVGITKTSLLNLDKAGIKQMAEAEIVAIIDGDEDICKAMIYVAKGIEYFTLLDKNLRPYLYAKQMTKQTLFNAEIEPAQLGTKYDYEVCQDHILDELNQELEKAKKAVTDRQNFLKAIQVSANLVDDATGEVFKVYAPNKLATSGYKISLK